MKKLLLVALILGVVVGADYIYSFYRVPPELDFHSLSLTAMDGSPVNIAALKGKKLLINFFTTSDDSSAQKMPLMELAQAHLLKDNFLFLCISDEPIEQLQQFKQRIGTKLIFLHSTKKMSDLKIMRLPAVYVLNPNGELVYRNSGINDWSSERTLQEIEGAK